MRPSVICNVCDNPATFEQAVDNARVRSNVRALNTELYTVWRCDHCRSLHSKESLDLDEYYQKYITHDFNPSFEGRNSILKWSWPNYYAKCIYAQRLRMLNHHGFDKRKKILDYGCGEGQFLSFLEAYGYSNVSGYDPFSMQYADKSVLQNTYDVIISQDVIEHVEDPQEHLAELNELLKPGGILAVGTPNADEISLDDTERFLPELHQPFHRHILSESILLSLGKRHKLRVIYRQNRLYIDTFMPGVNTKFIWGYLRAGGNDIDMLIEKPSPGLLNKFPILVFFFFFGRLWRHPGHMLILFRKQTE